MECDVQERGIRSTWDTAGMMMSLLCLVHCVALPAMLALLPLLDLHYHPDEKLHTLLTFFAVPIAAIALVPAYLKHRHLPVLALGLVGVVLLLTHHHDGHGVAHWPATFGAVALVWAHAWNFRLSAGCCYK